MPSATDAPLVETTVPTDGQTPPQPAPRPQPTTLAPRRVTAGDVAWAVLTGAGSTLQVVAPVAALVATGIAVRSLLAEWRFEIAAGLLLFLLVGTAFFRVIDLLVWGDDR